MHGLSLFFRLSLLAFTSNQGRIIPLSVKRFLLQCLFVPAMLTGWILHSLAFLLDDILFPGYRRVEVKEPLFLVGIARSGTTFLHRLLAEDSERFTTFQFWELLLAPAIIERKCVAVLARMDSALGGWGRKGLIKFDTWLLAGFKKMHHLSLFEPEEDEWLLMHRFASAFLVFPFPFLSRVRHLLYFDEVAAPETQKRIMKYYKRCVQRHLYVHGPEKRLLSKNPSFSAKVQSVAETFPDAKIACCVRNPYEAVPSFASLMWFIWGQTPGRSEGTPEMRAALLDVMDHFYRHPMNHLEDLPEHRQVFVHYEQLVKEPKATVEGLYRRFGLELTPEFAQHLEIQQEKARRYKSGHTYAVEHYGLTRNDIAEHYRDILEHYGFPES